MPSTLRITHRPGAGDTHSVTVELTGDRGARLAFSATFDFAVTEEERQRIQWYLETYLKYPQDPAPELAKQAEQVIESVGLRLFEAVFEHDRDARRLWDRLEPLLPETRIEVASERETGWPIPWELLLDSLTKDCLAIRAQEFVRAHPEPTRPFTIPDTVEPPIRILLAICRPKRELDVRFHSVARKLVAALGTRENFQLDVLRPPTFDALAKRLRQAKAAGRPYHILHFDGHGAFLNMQELFEQWGEDKPDEEIMKLLEDLLDFDRQRFSPSTTYPKEPKPGDRGYLVFENDESAYNLRFVDGPELGALLAETGVPVLLLNACRSGRATEPTEEEEEAPAGKDADRHGRVRAFGSLAQEVLDAGVPGVLAMRYNVYVVTAAEFVGNLYEAFSRGATFGAAASAGRKNLFTNPLRTLAYDPIPLKDWMVPVVYEAAPIRLFPTTTEEAIHITVKGSEATPGRGDQVNLPDAPDHGFWGRDETRLALDRAFDKHPIVLLHGFAGCGKTTTAAEFARWYSLTGGVKGPVLFTSFDVGAHGGAPKTLARVLDIIGQVFGRTLEQAGIHWLTLDDADRQDIALQVLNQIPVLWLWDNVEPIAGFPTGTESAWSAVEQKELADFLRAARGTQAKFLLTSRRDERDWLGDLPRRIQTPPMPMLDRVQLARALAEKQGKQLTDVAAWRPLLRFTEGNPLTITVLVRQALRDGLDTREAIEAFVEKLRAGEAEIDDEESEGRSKSLGASLNYGFAHAFNEDERTLLALLHFFQGFVQVGSLRAMGEPDIGNLSEVRGLTREEGITLLDRATEVGLLTAHGDGYYSIHPALPWYFKGLFEKHYPAASGDAERVTRAFVETMGELGNYYHDQYADGNRDVIAPLTAEEANFLHARRLARTNGWGERVISMMQGLRTLYNHTGRRSEWIRLVEEIVPDFVDAVNDGPLPGWEEKWNLVTEYRVHLFRELRAWRDAKRLQGLLVDWARQQASVMFDLPLEGLDIAQRNVIRSLAISLHGQGQIQRELGEPMCVLAYEEAANLLNRVGDCATEAIVALNLGQAYMNLPTLRDLNQAEHWYQRSLRLRENSNRQGHAQCLGQLGYVAWERFQEARGTQRPKSEQFRHLNDAARFYNQVLDLLPAHAVDDLAVTHNQLGNIYGDAGDLDLALTHRREAIRYSELAENLYHAAETRYNATIDLFRAGRFADAREYALAALRNYQTYGDRAAAEIQRTEELIAKIEARRGTQ